MKKLAMLSWVLPFVALSLCILGLFAMRMFPSPLVGIVYGVVVLLVLISGVLSGVLALSLGRGKLLRNEILSAAAGTLAGWGLLSFLLYFGYKAYIQML